MTDELPCLIKQGVRHLLNSRHLVSLLPLLPCLLLTALLLTGCDRKRSPRPAGPGQREANPRRRHRVR